MKQTPITRRHALRTLGALCALPALALPAAAGAAQADAYPSKPIRLVVPFPPGGGTDVVGRLIAAHMGSALGTTVVVENIAGATGTIGSAQVARAAPDGYTLLLGITATHAIAPAIFPHLAYDPLRDFQPVGRLFYGGNVLVVNPAFPARDLKSLIALAKKPGADITYGSWGNGSGGHLSGEALNVAAGIHLRHVPYRGVSPMLTDLMGGTLQVAMADVTSSAPLIRTGKIRAIAVTGTQRSPAMPDVPTFAEAGGPAGTDSWYALFAPAKTPAPIVDKLEAALQAAMRDPAMREQASNLGMRYAPQSRADFVTQWRSDTQTWTKLVKSSGAVAD